jgi:dimethylamine/trimethylamine dehydrogenase
VNTLDYRHIRKRMAKQGIEVIVSHNITAFDDTTLTLENGWDGQRHERACDAIVLVTSRLPHDALYQELLQREADWADAGIRSLRCIGDAEAPGLIAHAIYAGHRYARELEEAPSGEVAFRRHFHTADANDLRRTPTG